MMGMSLQILVVDPHKPNRTVMNLLLANQGAVCVEASSVSDAAKALAKEEFDAVICCASLLEGARELTQRANAPFVFMANAEQKSLLRALRIESYLLKPVTPSRLRDKLEEIFPENALEKRSAV